MTQDPYAALGVANPHQPLTEVEHAAGVLDPTADRYDPVAGDIVEVTLAPRYDGDVHPWNGTRRAVVKRVGDGAERNVYLTPVEPITTPPAEGMDIGVWADEAAGMWWNTSSVKPIRTSDPEDPANQTVFAWVWAGIEISTGDADAFANFLSGAHEYGTDVQALYTAVDGKLQPATWTTTSTRYNSNDIAYTTVVISLPNGRETAATYRVDGRG